MPRTKKVNLFSFARFQAVLFGLLGVLAGVFYAFGGLVVDTVVSLGWVSSETGDTPGLSSGTLLAFGALVAMPIIGVVAGWVTGLIEAILFNVCSRWVGGITGDFLANPSSSSRHISRKI